MFPHNWIDRLLSKHINGCKNIVTLNNAIQHLQQSLTVGTFSQSQASNAKIQQELDSLKQKLLKAKRHEMLLGYPLKTADSCTIYTMLDPNGGGTSDYAVVSICITKSMECLIVGLASLDARSDQTIQDMLQYYFTEIKQHPVFKYARHLIGIEQNYGGDSNVQFIYSYINRVLPRFDKLQDSSSTNEGLWTTAQTKFNGVICLKTLFAFKRIYICQQMVWYGRRTKYDILMEFKNQLTAIRQEGKKITGKIHSAAKDDMVICLILLCHWIQKLGEYNTDCHL